MCRAISTRAPLSAQALLPLARCHKLSKKKQRCKSKNSLCAQHVAGGADAVRGAQDLW